MQYVLMIVGGVFLMALVAILAPLGYAFGGWFTGYILANLFTFAGDWIVTGVNALGLTITRDTLPYIGAFLGFVGAFFRASQTNNNKSK